MENTATASNTRGGQAGHEIGSPPKAPTKSERVNAIEGECARLAYVVTELEEKVATLQDKVDTLEEENMDLHHRWVKVGRHGQLWEIRNGLLNYSLCIMANKVGKRKQSNFTSDDVSILQHDDLSQIANAQPDMPNRGDKGPRMTLRTQVGKRIHNGLRDRQYAPIVDANYLHRHDCVNISPTWHTGSIQKDADALNNHPDNRCMNDSMIENEHMNDIIYDSDNIVKETRGGESSTLSHFLGSISRNGKYCPIDVMNWHKMPSTKKTEILDTVKLRFNVSHIAEKWILSSIGHKWRNWKHFLKTKYWADVPIENLIDGRDERVLLDQWIKLLTYWSTDEVKKVSKRNKDARDKKIMNQRTGKTSFAQIRAKLVKEKGRSPTRVELFNSCFFNSNGSSDVAASSKYAAMQEHTNQLPEGYNDHIGPSDVFAQVMGQDKSGHVRMLGQGICPSDVWGETPRYSSNRLLMQKESRIL
ncbi:hypothetical protein C2S51_000794 [Perilla frutescens var. frutescens]|nr:hypothetical protein C2S51_000794 [Perilla frutescens var. frutescens]